MKRKLGFDRFYESLFNTNGADVNKINNLYSNDLTKVKQTFTLIAIAKNKLTN